MYCYPADANSSFVPLLFEGIRDRYVPLYRQQGSLDDALDDARAGGSLVVHVHWEEFVLRECRSEAEADRAAEAFVDRLEAHARAGVPLVWSVHNELPHEIPYHRQFLRTRAALARHADAIVLHDVASREVLARQVAFDDERVVVLPHPSYFERFEDETTLRAGLARPPERRIQAFGWIRLQKGFGDMIGMLPAAFLAERGAHVRISGRGVEAAAVIAQQAERLDVHWDLRHVPDLEIPHLLRSAACVILPYERVLTSGVALLAMSVGAVIVAVDRPQLRELLAPVARPFLYARGDAAALQRAVDSVLLLSMEERREIVEANLAIASELRPAFIAGRLAALYDRLRRAVGI